ncbi:MAG: hydrogenase nickel incorporation protein HypB [Pelotomaculum sp.]|uniref:Ni2+-binding GTPase n=1 Tax=Pelotomaculum thermopropionicum (strain DSM 13744 / JCM 10971 / SI) TaxID=370438 RepID=A5D0Q1_PELTS|nr:hydrogenase nickel incorporation protein HypB [Pelotomaculum sp.]BAF60190.1 Ni2+-binding GTPase [Pelotomaculum thermopropionicum SI]
MQVKLISDFLDANSILAGQNRRLLNELGVFCVNLMGAPGSGKTAILERTIDRLGKRYKIAVIGGDIYTDRDAGRIAKKGVQVIQINTRGASHLEAGMIFKAMQELELEGVDVLFIENVGNLVCPAEFDLGEDIKVMTASVAGGHDKPAKYPLMYSECRAVILNKIDLLPYTDFDMGRFISDVRKLNPNVQFFSISARSGEGIEEWAEWLGNKIKNKARQLSFLNF